MQITEKKQVAIIPSRISIINEGKKATKKLRVAAYCRVSTLMEHQETSYEAQVAYYESLININLDWKLVDIYADDGITGVNTKKREEFNRMIKDCMNGKIDMVITKSISRFARNTVDSLKAIRQLKEKNIAVYFETNKINILEQKGELLITILSSQAQEESRNLSEIVHWGMVRSFEKGEMIINHNNFMGYTKNENGEMIINEKEAEVVRKIFREYLEGKGTPRIKVGLEADGIKTKRGKDRWSEKTILAMLSNEKYMGDALLQKTYMEDFLTKTRKTNEGVLPQYYIENNHPAIISKEIFYRVQEELARRSQKNKITKTNKSSEEKEMVAVKKSRYVLSGLTVCSECGHTYRRITWARNGEKKIVYRCSNKAEHGIKYCKNSPTLEEAEFKQTMMNALNRLSSEPAELRDLIASNMDNIIKNDEKEQINRQMEELQQEMGILIKNRSDYEHEAFEHRYNEIGEAILNLKKQNDESNSVKAIPDDLIDKIREQRIELIEFDEALVYNIVKKIRAINTNLIEIELKLGKVMSEKIG